jgi:hypothetical protein
MERVVLGSFPPSQFTNPIKRTQLCDPELDFFFGSKSNTFWQFLSECYNVKLLTKNSIKSLLKKKKLG